MVVQHLYNDYEFDSPFLIVYIGTSLFSIFLPIRFCYERYGQLMIESQRRYCCKICHNNDENNEVVIIPWKRYDDNVYDEVDEDSDSQELMLADPSSNENRRNGHQHLNIDVSDRTPSSYEPTQQHQHDISNTSLLSHQDHILMATKVAPLWFLSNYFYAMSLELTSIASSTVLASMGSIFSFGFATCSRFGDEQVTRYKTLGVILCFMGGVATAWTDVGGSANTNNADTDGNMIISGEETIEGIQHHHNNNVLRVLIPHVSDLVANNSNMRSLLGDLAGLTSAIGYGAYTVLLRHLCPKDESRMSMQLFFGYIGLLNMVVLLPVAIYVIVSSNNRADIDASESDSIPSSEEEGEEDSSTTENVHTTLTSTIFLFLILKGLLDNVLSDYLWARAVILTSATVASVGVGLTIPMAFLADWFMGYSSAGLGDVFGAIFVLLGFVFVNINVEKETPRSSSREEDTVDFEEELDDVVRAEIIT